MALAGCCWVFTVALGYIALENILFLYPDPKFKMGPNDMLQQFARICSEIESHTNFLQSYEHMKLLIGPAISNMTPTFWLGASRSCYGSQKFANEICILTSIYRGLVYLKG